MSDPTNNGDAERTNLAPILAPIITLFIGFGAGVVFSEFIPLGKAPVVNPPPSTAPHTSGPRDNGRERGGATHTELDPEARKALEEAAAKGDEASKKALEELDHDHADHTDHTDHAPNGG